MMRLVKTTLSTLLVAVTLLGIQTSAFAQEEEAAAEPSAASPTPAPAASSEEGGSGTVEGDLDLYWGAKRDVSVVQKRLFTKDGRVEFTVFGGVIPNDPFLTYIPVGGRFNYYFLESISLEVAGSWTGLQSDSELASFLKNERNINAQVDLLDIQQWRANAGVVWSPFYGKLALLQRKLGHFDFSLMGGFGALGVQSPKADRTGFEDNIKPEGVLGAGLRFFLDERFSLRIDFRQGIFEKIGGGVSTPSEITLGISVFAG
jgi:outer membrane beta-barrel protein